MPLRLLNTPSNNILFVEDGNLELRQPLWADFAQWQCLRKDSEDFLRKWEPRWPHDDLTKAGYRRRLHSINRQWNMGVGKSYFLFQGKTNLLIGGASISKITKGTAGSATLGYWMGERYSDKGYMSLAAARLIEHSFQDLQLNRIEAAALPSNKRSIHLLEKLGFEKEGIARQYLEINGATEDHILFARLKSNSNGTGKQGFSVV